MESTSSPPLPWTDGLNILFATNFSPWPNQIDGVELPFSGPGFNESVVRLNKPADQFIAFARGRGVLAGISLAKFDCCTENDLLVAVTEKRTAEDIKNHDRTDVLISENVIILLWEKTPLHGNAQIFMET